MPPPHLSSQPQVTHTTSAPSPAAASSPSPQFSPPHLAVSNLNVSEDDINTTTHSSERPSFSSSVLHPERRNNNTNGNFNNDRIVKDPNLATNTIPGTSRKSGILLNPQHPGDTHLDTVHPTSSGKPRVQFQSQAELKQQSNNQRQHMHHRQPKSQSQSQLQSEPQSQPQTRSHSQSPSRSLTQSQAQTQPKEQTQAREQAHAQEQAHSYAHSKESSETQSQAKPQLKQQPRSQSQPQSHMQLPTQPQQQIQSKLRTQSQSQFRPLSQQKKQQQLLPYHSQPQPQTQKQQKLQTDLQARPKPEPRTASAAESSALLTVSTSVVNPAESIGMRREQSTADDNGNGKADNNGGSNACLRVRQGRPPNINENPLIRRLECILSVQRGHMSVADACREYEISARTYYRWLRDKTRLVQLTGISEADLESGDCSPIGLAASIGANAKPTLQRLPSRRMSSSVPPPLTDNTPVTTEQAADNLPRLPTRPAMPIAPITMAAHATTPVVLNAVPDVASKRRFPRRLSSATGHLSQSNMPQTSSDGIQPIPPTTLSLRPGVCGELPQYLKSTSTEPHQSETRPVIHGRPPPLPLSQSQSQQMSCQPPADVPIHSSQIVHSSPQSAQPSLLNAGTTALAAVQNSESMSLDTRDPSPRLSKRLKMQLNAAEKAFQERSGLLGVDTAATSEANISDIEGTPFRINGYVPAAIPVVAPRLQPCNACSLWQQKRRVEVVMQNNVETFAWYAETAASDIKEAISRRFALPLDIHWALVDADGDEITISWALPSARYTINIYP